MASTTVSSRVVAARVAAVATAVFSVASLIMTMVSDAKLSAAGYPDLRQASGSGIVFVTPALISAGVGVTLLLRRPLHPVGWLFAALATALGASAVTWAYGAYGLFVRADGAPGAQAALVVSNSVFILWFLFIGWICALTPDGAYLSNRWRLATRVMIVAGLVWFALRMVSPLPLDPPFEAVDNPWAVDSAVLNTIRLTSSVVFNIGLLLAAASLVVRYVRARGEVRRQLMWVAVAAVVFVPLVVVSFIGAMTDSQAITNVAAAGMVVLLPVSAALAVSRYHLYDVDRILSRAVTYVIVSTLLIGAYVAVVVVLARAFGQAVNRSPTATTLGTLVAAAAARPVYMAVRDAVDRRFLRRRYDALRQVRAFVSDPSGHDVESVLRSALQDADLHVAYWDDDRASWVTEDGHIVTADPDARLVMHGGRTVAAVTTQGDDEETVKAVLKEAAPELESASLRAAIAVQLEEVRASRERIAKAQLDERRRIERDLHDGAQQRLLGSAAQMQAALLNGDADRLRAALESGVREARNAVVELRALANGLHSSLLADGGLTPALEELSARVPVSIVVGAAGRRYPPLVESTAWFVACEAVANSMKHASPSRVEVRLDDRDGELRVVIVDNGCGGADPTGSGLRGLADRVEAVGGRLIVEGEVPVGTRIEAVLPCG